MQRSGRVNPLQNKKSKDHPPTRRKVLAALSVTGLASSSVVGLASDERVDEAPIDDKAIEYRETDHIRQFYELARR